MFAGKEKTPSRRIVIGEDFYFFLSSAFSTSRNHLSELSPETKLSRCPSPLINKLIQIYQVNVGQSLWQVKSWMLSFRSVYLRILLCKFQWNSLNSWIILPNGLNRDVLPPNHSNYSHLFLLTFSENSKCGQSLNFGALFLLELIEMLMISSLKFLAL